ncbi:hypothetical protein BZA77DRAFT_329051, partial [Pyronema omphalodes]
MAEFAIGVVLAVPGIVDILIKTGLEGYRAIDTASSAGGHFEAHRLQFNVEQQRFKDLTTTITLKIQQSVLKADDSRYQLISRTLARIVQKFYDFEQLESRYGVRISPSNKSKEKPSKMSLFSKLFYRMKPRKDKKNEIDAMGSVSQYLKGLDLDGNLEMETLKTFETRLKSVVDIYEVLDKSDRHPARRLAQKSDGHFCPRTVL